MASSDRNALNAWDDDDWTKLADKSSLQTSAWTLGSTDPHAPGRPTLAPTPASVSASDLKLTRAQREIQHREENQRIWEEANAPVQFSFLDASTTGVPLSDAFRPVRVLTRTPVAPSTPTSTPALARRPAGASSSAPSDPAYDSSSSSAHQRERPPSPSFEERQAKLAREREEKQRRYEEARAKIFGAPAAAASTAATAASAFAPASASVTPSITPPATAPTSGAASPVQRPRGGARGRGGRGGRGAYRQNLGFEDREQVLVGSNISGGGTTMATTTATMTSSSDSTSSPRGGRRGRAAGTVPPGLGSARHTAGLMHAERAPRNPEAGNRGGFAGRRGRGGRGSRGAAPGGGVSLV